MELFVYLFIRKLLKEVIKLQFFNDIFNNIVILDASTQWVFTKHICAFINTITNIYYLLIILVPSNLMNQCKGG